MCGTNILHFPKLISITSSLVPGFLSCLLFVSTRRTFSSKTKNYFTGSSIFKLIPKCLFKVLKNIHAICQLIAFGLTAYGIVSIMHHHEENKKKFDVRSMHAIFGWVTFIFFGLVLLVSLFIFIPPFISQANKKLMIGVHSLLSFCTLFFAMITMMTGNITNFDYIVP